MAGQSSSNGVWSRSEIKLMKSLITRHNNNDDDQKRDIVDVLQERFSYKEKHQVTDMYLDIAVEMMNSPQPQEGTGNGGNDVVQPVENSVMNNAAMAPVPQPAINHGGRYWTPREHSLFLLGLRLFGRRGTWRDDISMLVETRTPLQVSIHAQKFFRRMERATKTQLNDINLYEALASASSARGQGSSMDDQARAWSRFMHHADLGSYSQVPWTGGQQMLPSAAGPEMEGAGDLLLGDLEEAFVFH